MVLGVGKNQIFVGDEPVRLSFCQHWIRELRGDKSFESPECYRVGTIGCIVYTHVCSTVCLSGLRFRYFPPSLPLTAWKKRRKKNISIHVRRGHALTCREIPVDLLLRGRVGYSTTTGKITNRLLSLWQINLLPKHPNSAAPIFPSVRFALRCIIPGFVPSRVLYTPSISTLFKYYVPTGSLSHDIHILLGISDSRFPVKGFIVRRRTTYD